MKTKSELIGTLLVSVRLPVATQSVGQPRTGVMQRPDRDIGQSSKSISAPGKVHG
jgi:hypothetical protein